MSHPMRPTPEQLSEWLCAAVQAHGDENRIVIAEHVAHQAYAAGADAELEACDELIAAGGWEGLREARRPLPTTPQTRALMALQRVAKWADAGDIAIIREVLEGNDG